MKSPRETLLARHRERSPALDKIRRGVIATELAKNESTRVEALRCWLSFNRIAWTSFATAWVAIIGLNVAANIDGNFPTKPSLRADTDELMEGVQRHQTQLAALLKDSEPNSPSDDADRTQPMGPRSDAVLPQRNTQIQTHFFA